MTPRPKHVTQNAGAASDPDAEVLAALALAAVPGIGPTYAKRLVEAHGSFARVFGEKFELTEDSNVPAAYAARIREYRTRAFESAEKQLALVRAAGQGIIALTSPDYPSRLKEIPDPPPVLFVRGSMEDADRLAVAIVGTRKASPGGLDLARELGQELAAVGVTVVSGMALGIDAAAHRGVMEDPCGRTIAVLGCGADICYPPRNRDIYERIVSEHRGAILSEYPPETDPAPHHFPARNRIVSGLSLGVVVVEAPQRSGALITARCAAEQGREVFAVPHPARSAFGAGANLLIREGAHLIESAQDILSVIEYHARQIRSSSPASARIVSPAPASPAASRDSAVLELIRGGVTGMDQLVGRSGTGVSTVLAELTRLEIEGRIRRAGPATFAVIEPRR